MNPFEIIVERIEQPRQPHPIPLTRSFLDETFAGSRYTVRESGKAEVFLTRLAGRDVLVEASAHLSLQSACRRCLTDVPSSPDVSFSVLMVHNKGAAAAVEESEGDVGEDLAAEDALQDEEPYTGETFDLSPLVREQLFLSLPLLEPLCKEQCLGLCSTCGHDLNTGSCGHSQKAADPRWAKLQSFKM